MTLPEARKLLLVPANRPPMSEVEQALLLLIQDLKVKFAELYLICTKK